jgi:hypothetical protein
MQRRALLADPLHLADEREACLSVRVRGKLAIDLPQL